MADKNDEEKEGKKIQSLAALSIGLICVLVGLPVWWKTTEVYRVQLPYSEISDVAGIQVEHTVFFRIVSLSSTVNVHELESLVNVEDNANVRDSRLHLKYIGVLSPVSVEEQNLFKGSSSITDIDDQLQLLNEDAMSYGNYTVYILPANDPLLHKPTVVGTGHAAFVADVPDMNSLVARVRHVVRNVFVKEDAVFKMLQFTNGSSNMKADKESMRALRASSGYELTFTLLNPQPDALKITWNVESAVQKYLQPLLSALNEFVNVTVKSQYLYYTGLGVQVKKAQNESRLTSDQLPHIINPVEAYLGSHVSNNPNINFIVYVPTREQSPLHIYESSGHVSPTNAFLSPRWGGLMIYNVDVTPTDGAPTLPISAEIDMKRVLSVFIAQLRLLLGIPKPTHDDDIHIINPGSRIVSRWELDYWLRERCMENVLTSAATLKSLAELLDKISNIVINDDIGAQVVMGVESIRRSADLLAAGRLQDAFLVARRAREASEKAFFDPSLLELLYFPEDQKFAIYIPLFLPIGLPIILSLIEAFKWLRGSKLKEKKE